VSVLLHLSTVEFLVDDESERHGLLFAEGVRSDHSEIPNGLVLQQVKSEIGLQKYKKLCLQASLSRFLSRDSR
jgi:hypothetical protein